MAVGDAHVFPGFLILVPTQLFFQERPTTFLTCRGERRKYAEKKVRIKWGSNSQPPGHESDMLTTEPPGWGLWEKEKILVTSISSFSHNVFYTFRQKFVI